MTYFTASQFLFDSEDPYYDERLGISRTVFIKASDIDVAGDYIDEIATRSSESNEDDSCPEWYQFTEAYQDDVPNKDVVLVIDPNDDEYFGNVPEKRTVDGQYEVFVHDVESGTFYGAYKETEVLPTKCIG